ncbi:MAG: tRNA pseudouridine(38-40) synthase TruA [Chitinophagales bacterium]
MKIKLLVEYDGTDFHGFQRQPRLRTVDQVLEEAIRELTGEDVRVTGAGRTDAGVHALGQVVSFDTGTSIPPGKLPRALKRYLPDDIRIITAAEVGTDFHPCFSARAKVYRYIIYRQEEGYTFWRKYAHQYTRALDVEVMKAAAGLLEGEHDFRSFMASGSSITDCRRNIYDLTIKESIPWLSIQVSADGFLYHMVRNIAGTLLEVGRGAMDLKGFKNALEMGNRGLSGPTAPARGLYLMRVIY